MAENCEDCGAEIACERSSDKRCWCSYFPVRDKRRCFCAACLIKTYPNQKKVLPFENLKEDEDYYLERGCLVFTKIYHLKKGYCCGSNCRHCPYDFK